MGDTLGASASGLSEGALFAGKYRIERLLAEGAMGQVYVASQEPIGRPVAIKVLKSALATDQELVERFLREAVAVSNLHHPNTITVLDYGESEQGILYIAMEYLDGQNLEALLDRVGPLKVDRAVDIACQVASALTEAHHNGVLHRDLKPPNIFISEVKGKGEFVKVLDFGIAKLLDSTKAPLTRAGMVFGTPEYMAPEQSSGGTLDGRTDLYALGVVLWQMLTAKLPYTGTNPVDTLLKHTTQPIPPLPEHIPAPIRHFVSRAMAKNMADRPADAETFIKELRQAQAEASGLDPAKSPTSGASSERPAPVGERRRPWLSVALVLALLIVGGLVVGGIAWLISAQGKGEDAPEVRAGVVADKDDEDDEGEEARAKKQEEERETVLEIDCAQGRAEVLQGSKSLGKTPVEITGKPGRKLSFVVEKSGFKPEKETATFPKKGKKRVVVELRKKEVEKPAQDEEKGEDEKGGGDSWGGGSGDKEGGSTY